MGSLDVRIHLDKSVAAQTVILPQGVEGVNLLVSPGMTPDGNSCINDSWVALEPARQ